MHLGRRSTRYIFQPQFTNHDQQILGNCTRTDHSRREWGWKAKSRRQLSFLYPECREIPALIFNVQAPIAPGLFRHLQKPLTSYREKPGSTTFEESEPTTSLHTMSSHISCNRPFRAEHVGSFLRPDDLLHVRHAWNEKKATGIELKTAEDNAVNQIVKLQQDLGFHGINDG